MLLMAGCGQEEWGGRAYVIQDDSASASQVLMLSPSYHRDADHPETYYVSILWDGECLFEGWLPANNFLMGMPFYLVELDTSPGPHQLEVVCGEFSTTLDFDLAAGARTKLMIAPSSTGIDVSIVPEDVLFARAARRRVGQGSMGA